MNINTFKAFRSRNYRLYFSGQSVSLIGTWMQRKAVYWLIFVILAGFGMMSQSTVSNTIIAEGIAAIIIAVIFLPFLRADILKGKDKIKLIELEDPTVNSNQ